MQKTSLLVAELESRTQLGLQKMLMDHQAELAQAELESKMTVHKQQMAAARRVHEKDMEAARKVHAEQMKAARKAKQHELDVKKAVTDRAMIAGCLTCFMSCGMSVEEALAAAKTQVYMTRPARWHQPLRQ